MRRRLGLLVLLGIMLAGGGGAWYALAGPAADRAPEIGSAVPTTRVTRDSLALTVHMNGDLRASQQQALMAPPVGSALRILTMADAGGAVTAGDVILEFDPADQLYAVEQAESELLEAEQEIIKRTADIEAQTGQDRVALLTAQFDVRRAELDAAVDRDLIPANTFQIRQAALQEARRVLAQTEQDIRTRATVNAAGRAVLDEKRAKAQLTADRARQNIESLSMKAPIDGIVSIRDNQDASGGIFYTGMSLPQYRVGDTVNPGRPVLDIFDVSHLEIRSSVNEQERANVTEGQKVRIASNAVPGTAFSATVKAVAGLGQADDAGGPLRSFQVTLLLDAPDARLRPGTSVSAVVEGKQLERVLLLPRQAIFEKDGKSIVYARTPAGFEPRVIKIVSRTESRVALEGLDEGLEVALVNPEALGNMAKPAATGPEVGQ